MKTPRNKKLAPFHTAYLDFEFNNVTEKYVNLVCCSVLDWGTGKITEWWLHNDKTTQAALAKHLSKFKRIIGYATVAEGRSFLSLGIDPMLCKWIDLFTEYRMITNHNDELQWGKQLVDGKVKRVSKPKMKWERTEEDSRSGFKATHSLAEATFKLTGEIRDTKHKTEMRDLIISAPEKFKSKDRKAIQSYCTDDVIFLPKIYKEIVKWNLRLNPEVGKKEYLKGALERGRFQAATAKMESGGYPINYEATKNFSKQVGNILYDLQREINRLFPDIRPFRWNKKEGRFSWNQRITRNWIEENCNSSTWMKTDKEALSLSLEAFSRVFDFKHTYPENNFGAQMVRFLKLKQNLYGFSASNMSSSRKSFWDAVGKDGIVRPYLNSFAAQSSRTQPAATGFMFLKPAWMRSLVQPPPGTFMGGIDYGSEEFFISALKSRDMNMIDAYISGDPYFYFAKQAGAVPKEGKKEDYGEVRDLFKATVLGLSYLMSKYGLAAKLTQDTGREWDEEEAQEMIDLFYEVFWKLKDYQEDIQDMYQSRIPLTLSDGWTMWCDNPNFRSVTNMPIQGEGAVIMRRAIVGCFERGVNISFPLHDALYCWEKTGQEKKMLIMRDEMRRAFVRSFDSDLKKYAEKIRLDPFMWSPDYKPGTEFVLGKEEWRVKGSNLYVDKRSIEDYNKFSKYFSERPEDKL